MVSRKPRKKRNALDEALETRETSRAILEHYRDVKINYENKVAFIDEKISDLEKEKKLLKRDYDQADTKIELNQQKFQRIDQAVRTLRESGGKIKTPGGGREKKDPVARKLEKLNRLKKKLRQIEREIELEEI